jgi:diacylglycerol kinase (ATP)
LLDEDMTTDPILLIRNPGAGSAGEWDTLRDLVDADAAIRVETTDAPGDAARLAADGRERGITTIVAAGGDGTVSEVVQGIGPGAGDTALGIVPLGTGNDTVRSLGIPQDPAEALGLLRTGRRASIDLIEVRIGDRTRWVLNTCTGGFSAEVTNSITDEVKARWGRLAYLRSAIDVLREIPSHEAVIRVDGTSRRPEQIAQLVVGNGRFAGHGFAVAPEARMDDGWLDLLIARAAAMPKLLALLPDVIRREEPDSELIGSWRCRSVEVTLDPPMAISLDGEIEVTAGFRCTVRPAAIRVVVPGSGSGAGSKGGIRDG